MATMQQQNTETRSVGELREIEQSEGVFEGYAVVWDSIDSYNSLFKRGAFSKTLQERGSKVKLLWNHNQEEVIGKILELREDDYGLFIKAKIIKEVQRGAETLALLMNGAIDGLSFGFRTIKENFVQGVRNITEVALFEVSPVVFPAGPLATVTDVRAVDFGAMVADSELARKGNLLLRVLEDALWEAWWDADVVATTESVIDSFASAYKAWVQEYVTSQAGGEERAMPFKNDLSKAFYETFGNVTLESIAASSSLTIDEARALRSGELIAAREKLTGDLDGLAGEFRKARLSKVESLFSELRDDLTDGEKARLRNLLQPEEKRAEIVDYLTHFRQNLRGYSNA